MSLHTYKIIGRSNIGEILKSYLKKNKNFEMVSDNTAEIVFLVGSNESNNKFDIAQYPKSKIIDVSTNERLNSATPYNKKEGDKIYAVPHLTKKSEYKNGTYFSNPGCSAIGSITALAPIIEIIKEDIILDVNFSKSSLTRNSSFNEQEDIMTLVYPYSHFHQKEVAHYFGNRHNIVMAPTIIDVPNGISINIHAFKKDSMEEKESIFNTIKDFYKEKDNILISNSRSYEIKDFINTDKIGIYVKEQDKNILINIVLDNLTIGGALTAYNNALKIVGEENE